MKLRSLEPLGRLYKCGKWWRGGCPVHGGRDALALTEDADGTVGAHCFAGCDQSELIASLIALGVVTDQSARQDLRKGRRVNEQEKRNWMRRMWSEGVPMGAGLQGYLESRGLGGCDPGLFLRWHEGEEAMLGAITAPEDRKARGLHITYPKREPEFRRRIHGEAKGGAVRLHDPVEGHIAIGEGIETSNQTHPCLLYTSPSPRDRTRSRMPSSA